MPATSTPRRRAPLWTKVVAAAAGGALVLGGSFAAGFAASSIAEAPPVLEVTEEPVSLFVGRAAPENSPIGLRIPTCSVAELVGNSRLAEFSGVVLDPVTNEVLLSRGLDDAVAPASVMKLVTAAAALTVLGPERRFSTTVVATDNPETLVLVGGGDSTLSSLPIGEASVYGGAATLAELAEATLAALAAGLPEGDDVVIREVVVDSSLWPEADQWDSSWSRDAAQNGFISRVSALQVDGDRQNPKVELSPRTDRPAQRAGEAFVAALRSAGNAGRFVRVTFGTAPAGAAVLASVESQPVSELVRYMVKESDNTVAEMLARHISLESGGGGTAASLGEALPGALAGLGLPLEDITLRDGSGLSNLNRVTPHYVALLLAEVLRSQGALEFLRTSLPIAGVDGSLDNRFGGANASVQDRVHAKTGSISGVRSLAGYVFASDDTTLAFAFFALGDVGDATRESLESLVSGVHACGDNLGDF